MAEAKQCDRCGTLYLPYKGEKYEQDGRLYNGIDLAHHDYYTRLDLCPECMKQIISFLKMEESNGNT